jgi:hypothetical protein
VQVPTALATAQLRQAEVQALSQQTPSTQKPLPHSAAAAQGWPFGLGPQLPFWQDWPVTQSASLVQRSTHAPFTQRYGAQLCAAAVRQLPSPSQVPAGLRRSPLHAAAAQTVPTLYIAQLPTPSQAPVWPQAAAP